MQTPKARNSSSGGPQKISPRVVRQQLNTTALGSDSASSANQANRTPKDRSPKVTERRSPKSPVSENKRPSRVAELESQISQLQEDLKKVKDQLSLSESWKEQAQQDAEESKKQLLALSLKLEESQQHLLKHSSSEVVCEVELEKISEKRDQQWQFELEAVRRQHLAESSALASAMNEIKQLRTQLEMVAESDAIQSKHTETAHVELNSLKENLAETLCVIENMKNQLRDCKESETRAQTLIGETLLQLETAKTTIEILKSDGFKAVEAYNAIASELDQSRARVNLLEALVNKLKADICNAGTNGSQNPAGGEKLESEIMENERIGKSIELELASVKYESGQLRSALEATEIRYHEEQIRSIVQIRSAYELVEQMRSTSSLREAELAAKLKKSKADVEDLAARLMDKETELQGICEENEDLNRKLENNLSGKKDYEPEKELKQSKEHVENLKGNLMDKETELQNISEENQMLRLEIKRKEMDRGKVDDEIVAEVETARAAEREALMKLGYVTEEADKSNRRAARVAEQLDAAQATNSEMEAELRRLKVQSDQWRKAAEAAAAMLSTGNDGKFMERTGSLDSNYSPLTGKISSPYLDNLDDDFLKKKNGNMLKRIGVLWKKAQK